MQTAMEVFICLVLLLQVLTFGVEAANIIVETKSGRISGYNDTVEGSSMNIFLGIPYAKPPTGSNRFGPPETSEWTGIHNATNYAAACPQEPGNAWIEAELPGFTNYNEDCLYLNVFVPQGAQDSLPVLVFIHGGAWRAGTAQMYDPRIFAARTKIIVVTLNYRLGALGFLSTASVFAPGNLGLLDQAMALQWVHDNIQKFGGDPEQVTLSGHSVGGASVMFHMMSPLSKGLFNRAMSLSGVGPYARMAYNDPPNDALYWALELGMLFNCSIATDPQLLDCLRQVSWKDIIAAGQKLTTNVSGVWVWREQPVDGAFLLEDPDILWSEGKFMRIPMLVGGDPVNVIEGNHDGEPGMTTTTYKTKITELLSYLYEPSQVAFLCDNIMYTYRDWNDPDDPVGLQRKYTQLRGDMFLVGKDKAYKTYADFVSNENTKIYRYHFTYKSENDPDPSYIGVQHGDDLRFLFGYPYLNTTHHQIWTDKDREMSHLLMSLWSEFIRSGTPNPSNSTSTSNATWWPEFTSSEQRFLEINASIREDTHYRQQYMAFWEVLRPQIMGNVEKMTPTPGPGTEESGGIANWELAFWSVLSIAIILFLMTVVMNEIIDCYRPRKLRVIKKKRHCSPCCPCWSRA